MTFAEADFLYSLMNLFHSHAHALALALRPAPPLSSHQVGRSWEKKMAQKAVDKQYRETKQAALAARKEAKQVRRPAGCRSLLVLVKKMPGGLCPSCTL